jgi:hypothetical protein
VVVQARGTFVKNTPVFRWGEIQTKEFKVSHDTEEPSIALNPVIHV